jgi:DNA-directed RNA polymerase subunit N (RpoN/RPB10)
VSCGTVLADKYRYYIETVSAQKVKTNMDVDKIMYYTKKSENTEKSVEGNVLDLLGLKNVCCRRVMLTHVDIE